MTVINFLNVGRSIVARTRKWFGVLSRLAVRWTQNFIEVRLCELAHEHRLFGSRQLFILLRRGASLQRLNLHVQKRSASLTGPIQCSSLGQGS
jgi:hypothetical protein